MRTAILSLMLVVFIALSASAQSPSTGTQPAQQTPELKLHMPTVPIAPERRQLGILTLEPPTTSGQIVGIGVPVGELVVRGLSSVKRAQHRRAERKARAQVQRELADFLAETSVIKNQK